MLAEGVWFSLLLPAQTCPKGVGIESLLLVEFAQETVKFNHRNLPNYID